ncbi:hypothetical protein PLESTB_000550500 [Pleodorina starrii]|uniref:MADS-box domain-containing protein n=1 Tax=Pleodorina starrii TaxID=330485 RepID=A0A9W6F0G5_9CHLO|nr:hypothetical protein PLESTM_000275500 [Pleodorina starrii]GLC51807.1 hypothetical protein PLESTB_000550500 [Pleodorina starrii]GLC69520.1 hypothetical protein PLESTF_000841100 [Pleodorina starrii]
MEEMTRSKVQLQRIADDKVRQDMFAKRKQGLFKKAMELSVLCDCDVGLIIFGPGASGPGAGGQRLYQYSSACMDELLERYAAAVAEPHERRRNGELLRHYYELSPDEDGEEDATGRNGDGGASTSAAAAAAAATMVAVDSIILGSGGRRVDGRDGASGLAKRMRMHSPGLGVSGAAFDHLPSAGGPVRPLLDMGMSSSALTAQQGPGIAGSGGLLGNGVGPLMPPGAGLPLRRVGTVGGGLPLEGIKAAGFLDKRNYPVSPRSERAYEEVTAEFDKLTELRSQRAGSGGRQTTPTVLQPLCSSSQAAGVGSFSLAAQQQHLQQILHQQQLLQQKRQEQQQQGGGAKRFKPLSILVPEIQTHPIIPTNLTPLHPSGAGSGAAGANSGNGADGHQPHRSLMQQHQQQHPSSPFNSSIQHQQQPQQHQQSLQQQGGLPPRPPIGRLATGPRPPSTQPHGAVVLSVSTGALPGSRGLPSGAASPGPMAISPTSAAAGPPYTGANGPGEPGALSAPMDTDGGAAAGGAGGGGGAFALDRRSGALMGDDALGSLLGASAFRTSLDGSAANLLAIPSPPPHGTHALFGSLDGGPLSMRSSSHGMLGSLSSLDRGASLGLAGLAMSLESPGGTMGLDTALRGLAPMDVLDWPSSSPRSSAGNGDGLGSGDGGGGGFPDEGEGGTVLDGLIVRGTALSKLAPEAREAAIGPSPDTSGGASSPVSARGRMSVSAFSSGVGIPGGASTAAADPAPNTAAAPASATGPPPAQQAPQHGGLVAQDAMSARAAAVDTDAGGNPSPTAASAKPETAAQSTRLPEAMGSAQAPDRSSSFGVSSAGSVGLAPELSLNDLGFGQPGALAAETAAAVAAVRAQQGQGEGQG